MGRELCNDAVLDQEFSGLGSYCSHSHCYLRVSSLGEERSEICRMSSNRKYVWDGVVASKAYKRTVAKNRKLVCGGLSITISENWPKTLWNPLLPAFLFTGSKICYRNSSASRHMKWGNLKSVKKKVLPFKTSVYVLPFEVHSGNVFNKTRQLILVFPITHPGKLWWEFLRSC